MLTPTQQATLKAAIATETDQEFVALREAGATGQMAEWYNQPAVPTYTVWRTEVTNEEILRNGMDWTRVDNLSVGPARIWEWMMQFGTFNPAKASIRAGIDAVWKGTAADLAVRAAVYLHCQRPATRVEKLFATGVGTAMPGGSPAVMDFEGQLSDYDIVRTIND